LPFHFKHFLLAVSSTLSLLLSASSSPKLWQWNERKM
jgi:hypothetical protein